MDDEDAAFIIGGQRKPSMHLELGGTTRVAASNMKTGTEERIPDHNVKIWTPSMNAFHTTVSPWLGTLRQEGGVPERLDKEDPKFWTPNVDDVSTSISSFPSNKSRRNSSDRSEMM